MHFVCKFDSDIGPILFSKEIKVKMTKLVLAYSEH